MEGCDLGYNGIFLFFYILLGGFIVRFGMDVRMDVNYCLTY